MRREYVRDLVAGDTDVAWLATLGPSHTDDRPSYVSWRWRHLDEDAHVVS